jgi:tetratricopeptide (TPR) repeat protein
MRFGLDVHIDGDLIESPQSELMLTARGNGVPPRTFTGTAAILETLVVQAAEYVYSKSQPSRWAEFLSVTGRNAEAIEFCRTAAAGADPKTRADLLNDWANAHESTGGSPHEALVLYREAVKLNPDL